MLLAVEGGRFFSSSALGYKKGLTLLLLGKNPEKKPMRVTPWNNQYQLVDQESQLASNKNHCLARGCASFLCFGRTAAAAASAGLETPSPLKVGPTQHHQEEEDVKNSPDLQNVEEKLDLGSAPDDDINKSMNGCSLRSSLKRSTSSSVDKDDEGKTVNFRNGANSLESTERRVQWTDVSGGELFVIREFEPSEQSGSDDEYENGNDRSCSCRLM